MTRVRWKKHEQEWLAKKVVESCLSKGIDPATADPRTLASELKEAVNRLVPDRQRKIGGISQVPWLKPTVEKVKDTVTQSETTSPSTKTDPLKKIARSIRRQNEFLERLEDYMSERVEELSKTVDEVKKSLQTIEELFLEFMTSQEKQKKVERATGPKTKIAVAGLHRHQFDRLAKQLPNYDIIPVDGKSPKSISATHIYVMRTTDNQWWKDVMHAHPGRASKVHSVSDILQKLGLTASPESNKV